MTPLRGTTGPGVESDTGARFAYRPALDGVRGVAVALVVAYHGGIAVLSGGFFGVDAFFVLSGFLITSLLLSEWARAGRVALRAFWKRRMRRLLPALWLVVAAVVVAAQWLSPPGDLPGLRGDALAALLYVANWRMIFRGSDYFAHTAVPSALQHTWSLGIEEQFYLLWPLLLVALRARPRALLAACVAGGLVSTVLAWVLYRRTDSSAVYYGTETRLVAPLIGCGLAILLYRGLAAPVGPGRRGRRVLAVLTVPAVVFLGWAVTHATGATTWQYHGGMTLVALAVAGILAHLVYSPGSRFARVMSLRPLVALGRVSYGLYLWHWPVFVYLTAERTGLHGAVLFAVRCAVALALATVSYVAVEKPIRQRRWPRLPSSRTALAATAAVTAAVAALVVGLAGTAPAMTGRPVNVSATVPHRPGRAPGAPRVDILGDSVAWTLGANLPPHPGLSIRNHAIQGCGISTLPDVLMQGRPTDVFDGCTNWPARWADAVATDDPDLSVILLDRWELMDRRYHGRYQHVGQGDYDAYLTARLRTAIDVGESGGASVVLLTAPYTKRSERPNGGLYPEDQPSRVDAWNRLLRAVAARDPRVTVLDLNRVVCPAGRYTWTIHGQQVRSDGLHFTPYAVQQVIAPWLLPELATVIGRARR